MGRPKYMFTPGATGNAIHMEMLSEPPPTPEKFQCKARLRRLRQQWHNGLLSTQEFVDAGHGVLVDYEAKP